VAHSTKKLLAVPLAGSAMSGAEDERRRGSVASWTENKAEGKRRRTNAWIALALAFCLYIVVIAGRDLLT
jgi:hypothetical protein